MERYTNSYKVNRINIKITRILPGIFVAADEGEATEAVEQAAAVGASAAISSTLIVSKQAKSHHRSGNSNFQSLRSYASLAEIKLTSTNVLQNQEHEKGITREPQKYDEQMMATEYIDNEAKIDNTSA